jgi:uncharacterized protein (DUF934 family)
MATIIKHRQIATDSWQLLKPETGSSSFSVVPAGDVIVPLAFWLERREALLSRAGRLGVWLDSHEEPAAIAGDLDRFALVAVNFPTFGDGRGYSIARLLRERYGYKGELRAIGDVGVVRDHLFFMAGCGFDAFLLRDDQDLEEALTAFGDFSDAYQASVERPLPLFRRRFLESPDGMEWS